MVVLQQNSELTMDPTNIEQVHGKLVELVQNPDNFLSYVLPPVGNPEYENNEISCSSLAVSASQNARRSRGA